MPFKPISAVTFSSKEARKYTRNNWLWEKPGNGGYIPICRGFTRKSSSAHFAMNGRN